MNALIEDYLRSTGVRYFRGHHDDEYFFLVDFVFMRDAQQGRLHVHLQSTGRDGADGEGVQLSITPDRYYPIEGRRRLVELAGRWNAGNPGGQATVHESSDPGLVGVSVQNAHCPADVASMASFVEDSVASAIELFGTMGQVAPPQLRDAG